MINPIAPRMAKTLSSFGHSECNRVNREGMVSVCKYFFSLLQSESDYIYGMFICY